MDIESRLAAIEENQRLILDILTNKRVNFPPVMSLKEAAEYTGFSADHFRRLAVEQRLIQFSRPSEHQKGKLLFRKADLDNFLTKTLQVTHETRRPGRKRMQKNITLS
jgi:hypothetical protein